MTKGETIMTATIIGTRETIEADCITVTEQAAIADLDHDHGVDWRAVKADFPIFEREINGKPITYLDSTATAQKPRAVIDTIQDFYTRHNANIHRGLYALSEEATTMYEQARAKIARFIHASSPREVIFTRNATEAINLVAYSWGRTNIGPGDTILITEMEHHADIVPWQILAQEKGATLAYIPLDRATGTLQLERLDDLLTEKVKLVGVVHVSNSLGTINPVAEIIRRAHEVGAVVLLDGAQSVPHMPVDVQALGCDFLAFSGHKMCGPTGIGVLWGRRELLAAMPPFLGGGDMIRRVTMQSSTYAEPPARFEAGTPPIAEAIGLGAACDYLSAIGMARVRAHEVAISQYALDRFAEVPGLYIYGPSDTEQRGATFSFALADVPPHDMASILDSEGIAIRAGHHCCHPTMFALDVAGTSRASFYIYNLPEDVDRLVMGLQRAAQLFGV
jgi:cysteine desulfurase / selenocysteine lyase